MNKRPPHAPPPAPLSWWRVLLSVLAAAFGVQSERNHARDFSQGRPLQFIIVALVFTVLFVLGIALAVQWALRLYA